MKYAKESDRLFFTTDLQNSVQSYSLQDSKLVTTSHDHPTPPSVFAISCNSQFLISTSTTPPTIHLADLSLNMLPILVQPQFSSAGVVAAAFHPERAGYFLLAFSDGTAAVFDATHFFRKQEKQNLGTKAALSGAGGMLAFMKGLHAQGTTASKLDGVYIDGVDPGTGEVGIGEKSWGITAVAFVPGRKATVVTAGADGKCCVIDFTQTSKRKAVLLKTWHLRRPAISLSVICSPQYSTCGQLDGKDDAVYPKSGDVSGQSYENRNESYYIAVGRSDGRVLLFDLNGKPLGEQTLDGGGAPIIDVEWTQVDIDSAPSRSKSSPAFSRKSDADKQRVVLRPVVLSPNQPAEEDGPVTPAKMDRQPRNSLFDFSIPRHTPQKPLQDHVTAAANYLDLMPTSERDPEESVVGLESPLYSGDIPTTPSRANARQETIESAAKTKFDPDSGSPSNDDTNPPPIPARPTPRPGGLLSMRRAHTDYSYQASADDSYLSLIVNARNLRNNLSWKAKGNFGPRPMRSRDGGSPLKSAMSSDDQVSSEHSELAWSSVAPPPPPHGIQPRTQSPTASIESFQTASSHVFPSSSSARSTDTVVDWDAGPIRRATSSLEEGPGPYADQTTPNQKGHTSLSVSENSPTPPSKSVAIAEAPIIQWPAFSPRYSGVGLHAAHAGKKSPVTSKPKQKGHTSVPGSSASYNSTAPTSSMSDDLVVQWPSLKKSPRIPELNKALSFSEQDTSIKSVRESATGYVLQTYTRAPSLSKVPTPRPAEENVPVKDIQMNACATPIEAILNTSLKAIRAEMAQSFAEQRLWLENLIQGNIEGEMALVEENRRLRAEVASLEEALHRKTSG